MLIPHITCSVDVNGQYDCFLCLEGFHNRILFPLLSRIMFISRITYVPAEHLEEFRLGFGQQSGGIMALDIFSSYTGR